MIVNFGNKLAKDLVEDNFSKEIRGFPQKLYSKARMKLAHVHEAHELRDLSAVPGNKLEKLKGQRAGYYSIRINDQWRVVFRFVDGNAYEVSVEDYH